MVELHVGRLANRYRLPPDLAADPAFAAGLDRIAARDLPRALGRMLPGALEAAGVGPDAAIAVRRLRLRLRLRGAGPPPERLAEAWAGALIASLTEALGKRGRVPATDEVALFADRRAAERAYLGRVARALPDPWWCRPLLGARGRTPRPVEIILGWIDEGPADVPGDLVRLLHDNGGRGIARLLTGAEATLVLDRLRARHRERLATPRKEGGQTPGTLSGTGTEATVARCVAALAPARPLLGRLEQGAVRRLFALAALAARLPGLGLPPDQILDLALAVLLPRAVTDDLTPAREPRGTSDGRTEDAGFKVEHPQADTLDASSFEFTSASVAPSVTPEPSFGQDERDAATVPPEAPGAAPEPMEHRRATCEVGFGGLLFLIRPLAPRMLALTPGEPLAGDVLAAIAVLALARLCARLTEGARQAVLERERPLMKVFCGRDDLPERLGACLDDARARELAQVALEELVMRMPPTLQAHVSSLGFAFGEHAGLCPREGADGRLVALLIRRGRLEVGPGRADLHLPTDAIDIAVRRAGLDIDPGWVPWLGRVIRFHYDLP